MTTIVLLAIAGVALYLVGEQLLRVGGAAIMALALVHGFVVLDEPGLITLGTFLWGLVPWLVGHWIHMTRQGVWASLVAETLLSPLARRGNQRAAEHSAAAVTSAPTPLDEVAVTIAAPTMPAVEDVGVRAFAQTEDDELDVAAEDALLFGEADGREDDCGLVDEDDEVAHLFPYSDRPLGRVVPRSRRRGSH